MNGPDHYREAERLAELAGDPTTDDYMSERLIQRAQVHATLALTAATAATQATAYDGDERHGRSRGWAGVA